MVIDTHLVERLIAEQYPEWAELPVRPVEFDGRNNRTFRLGDTMSVRLPSAEDYVAQITKEDRYLPFLRPQLPLPIPIPLATGRPGCGYPWCWSVRKWLHGEISSETPIDDLTAFAIQLAEFLTALQKVDASDGPAAGEHNFFRGGLLKVYDHETRDAMRALDTVFDATKIGQVWDEALSTTYNQQPVWVHGDVAAPNLLVKDGQLSAVIDFGTCAVGDPACDRTIAWTLFSGESRQAFLNRMSMPADVIARARGWALWKGLITFIEFENSDSRKAEDARGVVIDVLAHDVISQ